jgi:hypothetical protein
MIVDRYHESRMIPRLDMLILTCRTSSYECKTVARRILGSAFFYLLTSAILILKSVSMSLG